MAEKMRWATGDAVIKIGHEGQPDMIHHRIFISCRVEFCLRVAWSMTGGTFAGHSRGRTNLLVGTKGEKWPVPHPQNCRRKMGTSLGKGLCGIRRHAWHLGSSPP